MPYKSDKQRKFFNSPGAKKAGISQATVDDFNKASKGMDLPEKAPKKEKLTGMDALKAKVNKKLKGA